MCAQCMIGATTAAAGVTGMRAWLASRRFAWMTARRLRFATAMLVVTGLLVAGAGVGST